MSNKRKPGALFYFEEWNNIITSFTNEEIGRITKCALLFAQGVDISKEISNLTPKLRSVWPFLSNSLSRGDRSYSETMVKKAWGGYKTSHHIIGNIGEETFIV